jgi:sugar lactone lactonase YvrE
MIRRTMVVVSGLAIALPLICLTKGADSMEQSAATLTQVAYFPDQEATGIAVSASGRIFLSLPRLAVDVPISVGEVMDGKIHAYPDEAWNGYRLANSVGNDAARQFVCAQSVVMDHHDNLWVVDPAAPGGQAFVPGGVKLVKIDVATNRVARTYLLDAATTPSGSSINDVRFSPDDSFAYLSDVGGMGAIVVVDLRDGRSWRVLEGDISTRFDPTVTVRRDGKPVVLRNGQPLQLNIDGITISADGRTFYWQALTGKTVYSVPTEVLQDEQRSKAASATAVATTHAADGLWIDGAGRFYVTNPGDNAVEVADSVGAPLRTLVKDSRMRWPDGLAEDKAGNIYVVASFLGDSPLFNASVTVTPSAIFKISR